MLHAADLTDPNAITGRFSFDFDESAVAETGHVGYTVALKTLDVEAPNSRRSACPQLGLDIFCNDGELQFAVIGGYVNDVQAVYAGADDFFVEFGDTKTLDGARLY